MMHIYCAFKDIPCDRSWDANSNYKNSKEDNKIACACGLEDKIHINWSSGAHAIEIYHFRMNFYKIILYHNFFSQSTSMDVHHFIISENLQV